MGITDLTDIANGCQFVGLTPINGLGVIVVSQNVADQLFTTDGINQVFGAQVDLWHILGKFHIRVGVDSHLIHRVRVVVVGVNHLVIFCEDLEALWNLVTRGVGFAVKSEELDESFFGI